MNRSKDIRDAADLRAQAEKVLRGSICRLVRAGLTDWAISRRLSTDVRKVRQVRESVGLPANRREEW